MVKKWKKKGNSLAEKEHSPCGKQKFLLLREALGGFASFPGLSEKPHASSEKKGSPRENSPGKKRKQGPHSESRKKDFFSPDFSGKEEEKASQNCENSQGIPQAFSRRREGKGSGKKGQGPSGTEEKKGQRASGSFPRRGGLGREEYRQETGKKNQPRSGKIGKICGRFRHNRKENVRKAYSRKISTIPAKSGGRGRCSSRMRLRLTAIREVLAFSTGMFFMECPWSNLAPMRPA